MTGLNYGLPVRIFYANLLRHGVTLRVDNGTLKLGGDGRKTLSPAYRKEIERRAPQLLELLSPSVPEPLQSYTGRMLTVTEAEEAQRVATEVAAHITLTPVNGGWLMLIREF